MTVRGYWLNDGQIEFSKCLFVNFINVINKIVTQACFVTRVDQARLLNVIDTKLFLPMYY